ncbi:MAG: hypothetical protein CSYNP_02309 [Syntrophus sp. SKADARSKE-3]|nr:hypothetical protein [Syntrophus sp. SKADARSKE-3]
MEDNKVVTNFCYSIFALVVIAGIIISIAIKSWFPIVLTVVIIIGFFIISLSISIIYYVVFFPFIWIMEKLNTKSDNSNVEENK